VLCYAYILFFGARYARMYHSADELGAG
jgi:hypothetical protein